MNASQKKRNRKFAVDTFDKHFHFKEGVVKINVGNTIQHELAKFLICWELATNKHEFVTEVIFKNGKRADIVDLSTCEAWEILHSEKEENLIKKREDYPVKTYGLNSKKVLEQYKKVVL